MNNFYRIACAVPDCRTADVAFNTQEISRLYLEAAENNASIILFPAEAVSGYSCGALRDIPGFIKKESDAIGQLVELTRDHSTVLVFSDLEGKGWIIEHGLVHNAGSNIAVFSNETLSFSVVVEREAFSSTGNAGKVHLTLFPYASEDTYISINDRRTDYSALSRMMNCVCVACGAGIGSSTANGVCGGHALIAFDGEIKAETATFQSGSQIIYHDIDTDDCNAIHLQKNCIEVTDCCRIMVDIPSVKELKYCNLSQTPFIPENGIDEYARTIIHSSAVALANRLKSCRAEKMVLGISGGLDSTMALISCVECCRYMKISEKNIIAVSMPGFGTGDRTKNNSLVIAEEFGVDLRIIPISAAVEQHFKDIGHDPSNTDIVYENSQARERTQILMDIANGSSAIVVGTGDLSEIALGWCTYNGDQMSMYAINASIPKTLMRELIGVYASGTTARLKEKLLDICATPVSPELVPGKQFTEDIIGSYELHDFFLYHFIKYGASPRKLLNAAKVAFKDRFSDREILHTMEIFFKRFFSSQFKRKAMPDAPDFTGVNLARFQIPSDITGNFILTEFPILYAEL